MKRILLMCMTALSIGASAQIIVNEGFEGMTSLPADGPHLHCLQLPHSHLQFQCGQVGRPAQGLIWFTETFITV